MITGFILNMTLHPDVQKTAQAELERVVGNRLPTVDDIPNLPYIGAVVTESLRWASVTPLGMWPLSFDVPCVWSSDGAYNRAAPPSHRRRYVFRLPYPEGHDDLREHMVRPTGRSCASHAGMARVGRSHTIRRCIRNSREKSRRISGAGYPFLRPQRTRCIRQRRKSVLHRSRRRLRAPAYDFPMRLAAAPHRFPMRGRVMPPR